MQHRNVRIYLYADTYKNLAKYRPHAQFGARMLFAVDLIFFTQCCSPKHHVLCVCVCVCAFVCYCDAFEVFECVDVLKGGKGWTSFKRHKGGLQSAMTYTDVHIHNWASSEALRNPQRKQENQQPFAQQQQQQQGVGWKVC